jgi:hypothetical protein
MKLPYSVRFSIRDFFQRLFRGTLGIQYRLHRHLKEQNRSWPKKKRYTHVYFHQGLEEFGISERKT